MWHVILGCVMVFALSGCSDRNPLYVSQPPDAAVSGKVCEGTADIETLKGCDVVHGSVAVNPVTGWKDLTVLAGLREVDGNFQVQHCTKLSSLQGLESLAQLGKLWLEDDPLLTDLAALSALRGHIGTVNIFFMDGLVSFKGGLAGVTTMDLLYLSSVPKLDDLGDLAVERIGELTISHNASLASLKGLSRLKTIDGNVKIMSNAKLPKAETDAFLAHVQVGGRITIAGNGP